MKLKKAPIGYFRCTICKRLTIRRFGAKGYGRLLCVYCWSKLLMNRRKNRSKPEFHKGEKSIGIIGRRRRKNRRKKAIGN